MKISVLLSLYAKENPIFFDLAMKSIWNDQTRKPDEVVLVEDGPITKELEDIVLKWTDIIGSSFKVVSLPKNQGLAVALNAGILSCTGDYIARMDTDDVSMPQRLEIQERTLIAYPNLAVLGGAMIEFNSREEFPPRYMPLTKKEIRKAICKTSPFVHPSVCIRRDVLLNGFLFNPSCRRCQDLELWFRIIAAGYDVANVKNILLKFRKDENLYKKRRKSSWIEFQISIKGIRLVYGLFTWRYVYPMIHYIFRLLPGSVVQTIYKGFILKYWGKS